MLHFVGCGEALLPELGNNNAYFFHGNDLYLIDCGSSAFATHYKLGTLDKADKIYVFLSHLHADHAGSLGTLAAYGAFILHKKVNIITPEPERLKEFFRITGVSDTFYDVFETLEQAGAEGVSAYALPIHHTDSIPSHCYVISADGKTFYFSGDAAEIPETVYADFMADKIDYLYQDASRHPFDTAHLSYEKALELIPAEKRSRVWLMHYDIDYRDELKAAGFNAVYPEG